MNKTQTKEKCKEILYKYPYKRSVNKEDFDFLIELLQKHPNKDTKIGVGVKEIFPGYSEYKNRCFYIKRIDDSITDFSYNACINITTKQSEIEEACRYAIKNDILNIKQQSNLVAHHDNISFKKIVKKWLENKNINDIMLKGHEDNSHHLYFTDQNLEKDFINFHNNIATIKLVTKQEHLHFKKDGN